MTRATKLHGILCSLPALCVSRDPFKTPHLRAIPFLFSQTRFTIFLRLEHRFSLFQCIFHLLSSHHDGKDKWRMAHNGRWRQALHKELECELFIPRTFPTCEHCRCGLTPALQSVADQPSDCQNCLSARLQRSLHKVHWSFSEPRGVRHRDTRIRPTRLGPFCYFWT
jgi:hypothetical protein